MRLFTYVHGDRYIDWFKRALVPSLLQPKNFEALKTSNWEIVTDNKSLARVKDIACQVGIPVEYAINDGHRSFVEYLMYTMEECIVNQETFFMAPPDTIFSDGSIRAFQEFSYPGTCVAMTHVRVNETILDEDSMQPLVNLAWKHLHDSWVYSEAHRFEMSHAYLGGVSWRKLSEKIIAVQHRLPTVYLANFLAEDLQFFQDGKTFGIWDWLWPSLLLDKQRYRFLASSDAAFAVELTDPKKNINELKEEDKNEPDKYHGKSLHNLINRQFVSVLRME